MATYSDLQTRIERRVIDLPTAVSAEVPTLINEAIKALERRHNFKVMETLGGSYTTTADTHTLTSVPSDFKEFRGNPYYLTNLGRAYDISIVANRDGALDYFGNSTTYDIDHPILLLQSEPTDTGASNWEVWPYSDSASDYSDGEYRVYVPYYRYLPDLSNDSDTNWFTVNAEEYIIHLATAEAFYIDWDEQRGAFWEAKAEKKYNEVVLADKRYRVSGVKTFVPLWQGVNQPNMRT